MKRETKVKGNGVGPDPVHENYKFCIKTQAVDFDSLDFTDRNGQKHVVIAADNQKVTAVLLANGAKLN